MILTERIPVSEVEHVRVELSKDRTTPEASLDPNGFITWRVEIDPSDQKTLFLAYTIAFAPGVSIS